MTNMDRDNISPASNKPCDEDPEVAWYSDPKYKRYWAHYGKAQTWCKQHVYTIQQVKRREHILYNDYLMHSARASELWCQMYGTGARPSHHSNISMSGRGFGRGRGRGVYPGMRSPRQQECGNQPKRQRTSGQSCVKQEDLDMDCCHNNNVAYVEDIDEDSFEMEMTEDMVNFLTQSAKYKQERGKKNLLFQV